MSTLLLRISVQKTEITHVQRVSQQVSHHFCERHSYNSHEICYLKHQVTTVVGFNCSQTVQSHNSERQLKT